MTSDTSNKEFYTYDPNHALPATVLIYAGPPIYAAAEYNMLGRLMHYLPMYAPLHPGRLVYVFIYLGALVESLTAAGASIIATDTSDRDRIRRGGRLISVSLVLQAVVELIFAFTVFTVHRRCLRARGRLPRNVRILCLTLYGTSLLVLLRCIFRAVEAFSTYTVTSCNGAPCTSILYHEWYLYALEAAPMVLYTYWLNIFHPGRLLPREPTRYLDLDGSTERMGPGWVDRRSTWETFVDPFDIGHRMSGKPSHDEFWLRAGEWEVAEGSFATGTASNVSGSHRVWKRRTNADVATKA
ncbi:MAG: hypothetical protein Q9227_009103 [Pyrenula ochraceoflavens]